MAACLSEPHHDMIYLEESCRIEFMMTNSNLVDLLNPTFQTRILILNQNTGSGQKVDVINALILSSENEKQKMI